MRFSPLPQVLATVGVLAASAVAPVAAQETVVLRPSRMLDVDPGRMIEAPGVVVRGDRITSVDPGAIPAGAREIDLEGLTLLPGFIDASVTRASPSGIARP